MKKNKKKHAFLLRYKTHMTKSLQTFETPLIYIGLPSVLPQAKTTDEDHTDNKFYTIYPAKTRKQVKQWYSPSLTFLQLSAPDTSVTPQCGDTVRLQVLCAKPPGTVIQFVKYQVRCMLSFWRFIVNVYPCITIETD